MSAGTITTALVVLMLPAAVAAGWWFGGLPDLARVSVTGGTVRIVPRGLLRWLSFRPALVLEQGSVRAVSVAVRAELAPAGLRSPALAVPGLRAGTYRSAEAVSYWLVGRAARVVRLDLAGGPVDYVLLQVRDPEELAGRLSAGLALQPA